ncbi:MAG: acyltransferase [Prevotella sp.]|nr:acyltransferase [Prevotella sp.]
MPTQRIGYIDAIRGLTMLLVVYCHVEYYSYNISFVHTIFGMLFVHFRMPMFFFISGFIVYKSVDIDWQRYLKVMRKKAVVQIIPTLFFFHLFYVACQNKPIGMFIDNGPSGYWFTIALFYMFFLYFTSALLTRRCKPYAQDIALVIIAIAGAVAYGIGVRQGDRTLGIHPLLCFDKVANYFEFFVAGVLCRKYWHKFEQIISHDATKTILLLGFTACSIIAWRYHLDKKSLLVMLNYEYLVRYLGLFLVFSVFYHYRNFFDSDNKIACAMRYTGRHTLDIYLLHYFLLPKMPTLRGWAFKNDMLILELTATLLLSAVIIAFCLLISRIIRHSDFLGHYLLGAKRKK